MGHQGEYTSLQDFTSSSKEGISFQLYTKEFYHVRQNYDLVFVFSRR